MLKSNNLEISMIKHVFEHNGGLQSLHFVSPNKQEIAPLIVLFPAFDGHAEFIITYAHRLVDQGFQVVIADMYGKGAKFDNLEQCFEHVTPLVNDRKLVRELTVKNIKAAASHTDFALDEIGVMGFCIGGMCTLEAARAGLDIEAYFCAHGNLTKDENLETLCQPSANIMLAQGYSDPLVGANQLEAFAAEMASVNWSCMFYGNTEHSFTDHNVGAMDQAKEAELGRKYNPYAAEQCFQQAVMFFENHLC